MKVSFTMNKAYTLRRFSTRFKRAQEYLDNEVLKDSTPYVPMDTGNLYKSGIRHTVLGSGEVVWNTPYARINYYTGRRFRKTHHPKATSKWFEHAKSVNKTKWLNGAEKIVKG